MSHLRMSERQRGGYTSHRYTVPACKSYKGHAVLWDINITEWIQARGFPVTRRVLETPGCVKSIVWHCVSLAVSVHQPDQPSLVSERHCAHCSSCKGAKMKTRQNIEGIVWQFWKYTYSLWVTCEHRWHSNVCTYKCKYKATARPRNT